MKIQLLAALVIAACPVPGALAQAPQPGVVAAGTTFEAKLQQSISTAKARDQERFTLIEKNPLFGGVAALKGAQVEGHLESVVKAARGQKASLRLVFDDILLKDGTREALDATLLDAKIETKTKGTFLRNAGLIVGGAVAGHYLGKKTGLPLGGTAGAAAASAFLLNNPGGEVEIKRGTVLKLKLNRDLPLGSTYK